MAKEGGIDGRSDIRLGDALCLLPRRLGAGEERDAMSAIGFAYKSDRDEVNGWESVTVEPMPRLKAAYETAKADAEDAWDWFYLMVDQWEYSRMKYGDGSEQEKFSRDLMNDHKSIAENADRKKEVAYGQMNCPHVHIERYGDTEICEDCGARF